MIPTETFMARVQLDPSGCWLWTGAVTGSGYGAVCVDGQMLLSHRVSWVLYGGVLIDGLVLDHLCRTKLCCRPIHLDQVTQRTNVLRGEGLTARLAQVTHCPQNHPYDAANTYLKPKGGRGCRECIREAGRRYDATRRRRPSPTKASTS